MRKGKNPAKLKENNLVEHSAFHQVIVPVYLPELRGYYKDGMEILKLCIESIYLTTHDKTFISVVNNGSCKEVIEYLNLSYSAGKIQEIIHTNAIGKVNAITKAMCGHNFDLITITDADVLFTNGWQNAVYEIYENFPKAGMVCTTPLFYRIRNGTEMVFWDNFFNKHFKFKKNKNIIDQELFMKSIDGLNRLNDSNRNNYLSLEKDKNKAVVGAGHFSSTYRNIFKNKVLFTSNHKLSSKSDRDLLDYTVIGKGLWKLSTYHNYSYHLGNVYEDWMKEKFDKIKKEKKDYKKPIIRELKKIKFIKLKIRLTRLLIFNNYIWKYVLIKLGLSKENARNY